MEEKYTYSSYLKLDQILSAQRPLGDGAHHETFFIIIHQVFELWFKQVLFEVDAVLKIFEREYINEEDMEFCIARLKRVIAIQQLMMEQVGLIETMTPLDYLDFRSSFGTASGFQSIQFRLLENKLGLPVDQRIQYGGRSYADEFEGDDLERLRETEKSPSLFDLAERWLERTPFVRMEEFDFVSKYQEAVADRLSRQREQAANDPNLPQHSREHRVKLLQAVEQDFSSIFDEKLHNALVEKGERRFSQRALIAALFINVYREKPILQAPFRFLERIMDVDEHLSLWRYRHSLMVMRMIGRKTGSGGSAGYTYLADTVGRHRIFTDLFLLTTFLMPRAELPELPESLDRELGYYFSPSRKE